MRLKSKKIIGLTLILVFVFLPLLFTAGFIFYFRSGRLKKHMVKALAERTDKLVDIKALRFLSPTEIILEGVEFFFPRNPGPGEWVRCVFAADAIRLKLGLSRFSPFWKEATVDGPEFEAYGPEGLEREFRFLEELLGPRPRSVSLRRGVLILLWCDNVPLGEERYLHSIELANARGHLKWDGVGEMTLNISGKDGTALENLPHLLLHGQILRSLGGLESDFVIKGKRMVFAMSFLEMILPIDLYLLKDAALDGEVHLSSRGVNSKAVIKGFIRPSDFQELLTALWLRGVGGTVETEIERFLVENHRIIQFQAQISGKSRGKLDCQTARHLNFLFSGQRPELPAGMEEFTYDRLGLSISYDGQKVTFCGLVDEEGRVAIASIVNGGLIPLVKVSPEPIPVDLLRRRWQEMKEEAREILRIRALQEANFP